MDVAVGQGADLFIKSVGSIIAQLAINKTVPRRPNYTLAWTVRHAGGLVDPQTSGLVELSSSNLRKAFRLDDVMDDKLSLWLIDRYGGTVASQGEFIRWGKYLNIPGPGTGHDGDANISIFVSDEIRDAVTALLKKQKRAA